MHGGTVGVGVGVATSTLRLEDSLFLLSGLRLDTHVVTAFVD